MSDYASQTVAQLKELLKSRDLAIDGKKADLVKRLTEADAATATTTEADAGAKDDTGAGVDTVASHSAGDSSSNVPNTEEQSKSESVSAPADKVNEESTSTTDSKATHGTTNEAEAKVATTEEAKPEVAEEEKSQPKVLTAEERKQLAIELLNKKIHRAQKFGDEKLAEAAKKDLIRVEKFGVELGTGLAKEIGLENRSLGEGKRGFKKNFKKGNKNKTFKKRK